VEKEVSCSGARVGEQRRQTIGDGGRGGERRGILGAVEVGAVAVAVGAMAGAVAVVVAVAGDRCECEREGWEVRW
jgi:hypothetical protein